MKRVFIIQPSPHPARENAIKAVLDAQVGQVVTIADPTRNIDQNAKFHALCGDLSKSGLEWGRKNRSQGEWKVLLVSGHAIATKEGAEVVAGLEGEYVNLRESTALMTKNRGSSLIEYTQAFIENNVKGE